MSESRHKASFVATVVLLALHAVFGLAILWLLLVLVPKYEKLFKDFNPRLPDMTLAVMGIARFWYTLLPALAVDFAVVAWLIAGRTRLLTTWGTLVRLIEMLLIGLIMLAMFVPLNDLITNLSGGK